jgi:hypothetical protein
MFDKGAQPTALLQRVCSASRAEACAAADRLVAVGELFSLRMRQSEETADWAIDAMDAVSAEVAAALSISQGLAASHVRYARALREQLPMLGRAFIAGDIDETTFRTCVFRTGLIDDDDVLASVDRDLAVAVPRWGSMNRSALAGRIDKIVARVDLDAVRRRRDRLAGREVVMGDVDNGLSEIHATLFAPDAHAVSERLTALADTVCQADPRTLAERRADALGALGAGADRLGCRCGQPDCPAGGTAASAVVIHVLAEQGTLDGTSVAPGAMLGFEGLLPPELIAELAKAARLRPLVHPRDAAPEAGYVPSRALADFVRLRDLTCRFPGCDVPATRCDVDHSIPHREGGPTHASNLSAKCRLHHLLKTFWGWRDEQLRDGTIIWTSPAGERYVTTPGSALIFPSLCEPTGPITITSREDQPRGDRNVMMPRRLHNRDQQRAAAISAERRHNRERRSTPMPATVCDGDLDYEDTLPVAHDTSPPPF